MNATTWTNLDNVMLTERSQTQKIHTLYDCPYMKVQKGQIGWRKKIDFWLPLAGDQGVMATT